MKELKGKIATIRENNEGELKSAIALFRDGTGVDVVFEGTAGDLIIGMVDLVVEFCKSDIVPRQLSGEKDPEAALNALFMTAKTRLHCKKEAPKNVEEKVEEKKPSWDDLMDNLSDLLEKLKGEL